MFALSISFILRRNNRYKSLLTETKGNTGQQYTTSVMSCIMLNLSFPGKKFIKAI